MAWADHNRRIKLSIPGEVRFGSVDDISQVTEMRYDEVIYDYNTMSYKTLSQSKEIERLQNELAEKERNRKKSLKNIVGYFYKKR